MNMQTLLQNNTMRRQIHGPAYVNVGPAYIVPGSHGPRCQVMGQAGLAEALEKMVGRDRPGREFFENVMGWAGTRPILWKFDLGRATPHEMWAVYRPLRPPHEVAHVF